MAIKTRIAPSPTGMLHIGTARTALFNHLFAQKHNGEFLLRIEDTDIARNTEESYNTIFNGLKWLGLNYDGAIEYQSKRSQLYMAKIEELLNKGIAYHSYTSLDEIAKRKVIAQEKGTRYLHRYSHEDETPIEGVSPVLRLKVQVGVDVVIEDVVQGSVTINTDTIEDFILARSNNSSVYMFAVVCDDIDMDITHVIRGVDHLTNTAKQVLLYQAFGVSLPVFAHVPLIHGEGGAKLSKRHGAISTLEYKANGYLPEAIRAYLLRLGWSNGSDDILTDAQAIEAFDLKGIGRSPSQFDIIKLQSVNEHFIKNANNERLRSVLESDYGFNFKEIFNPNHALDIAKCRSKTLLALMDVVSLFKKDFPININVEESLAKKVQEFMSNIIDVQNLHGEFKEFLQKNNLKFKDIGPTFRMMLIGEGSSIGIFEIVNVLGFEEAKVRVLLWRGLA
ncbi:MAG: glutamyl-tRNA synthetase [Candidatus Deianiraeaceae bacterium]|jgi:glutamyl-tRNA synthetase